MSLFPSPNGARPLTLDVTPKQIADDFDSFRPLMGQGH